MECVRCHRDVGPHTQRAVAFAKRAAGVEYIHSLWWCEGCRVFTMETYKDGWSGSDIFTDCLEEERGRRHLARLSTCPSPLDDRCDCDLHALPGPLWPE